MNTEHWPDVVADRLVQLYSEAFGGKENGRYRISAKIVREMAGRRRLHEDNVRDLSRALYQKDFVLIDLDSFFVIMSVNAFTNYRRANAEGAGK